MASPFRHAATALAAATFVITCQLPAPAQTFSPDGATAAPRFVQEGTPVPGGGRLVQLGTFRSDLFSYSGPFGYAGPMSWPYEIPTAPDGVLDTAFVASSERVGVLRSDGSASQFGDSGSSLPQPAEGTTLTAMVMNRVVGNPTFALQSDGRLTAGSWQDEQYLPSVEEGIGYVALAAGDDVQYAVRTDGRLVGFAADPAGLACQDAWTPSSGDYVAVSAGGRSWMALRSDGSVVTCGYGEPGVAEVVAPPAGSAFTGVDAGAVYGLIARSDGQVTPVGAAPEISEVPAGRTIVSLSAGATTAAAVLDDGSLLTWGESPALSSLPEGADRFLAVAEGADGRTYALWDHELLPVDLTVAVEPQVGLGETAHVDVTVEAGGAPVSGLLCITNTSQMSEATCDHPVIGGQASFELPTVAESTEPYPGVQNYIIGFTSPATRPAYEAVSVDVVDVSVATSVEVVLPDPWEVGTYTDVPVRVTSADGIATPNGVVSAKIVVGEDDGELTIDDRWLGSSEIVGNEAVLRLDPISPAGTHTIAVTYTPHDHATLPSRWTGTAEVTSTIHPFEQVGIPVILGEARVGQILQADPGAWLPEPDEMTFRWEADGVVVRDGPRGTLPITASMLGKRITVTVVGSKHAYETTTSVTSAPTAPVQVGTFTTVAPVVVGEARVGETLSADVSGWVPFPTTQTYTWKANGLVIQSGPDSTLVVPRMAQGKRITVTVAGEREGVATASAVSLPTERVVRPLCPRAARAV